MPHKPDSPGRYVKLVEIWQAGSRKETRKPDSGGRYVKRPRNLFWDEGSLAAQRLAGKSSRHAQRILGADVPSRTLLLEFVKGRDLEHASPAFLRRNKTRIIRQLASALAEHSAVLHRDLNKGNIILSTGRRKGRVVRPIGLKLIDYEKASLRGYPLDVDMSAGVITNFDYSQIRREIIPYICERMGGEAAKAEQIKKLQDRFEREFVRKMVKKTPGAENVRTMHDYITYVIKHPAEQALDREKFVGSSLESLKRGFTRYSDKQAPETKTEAAKPAGKTGAERLKERIRRSRWRNALVARNQ